MYIVFCTGCVTVRHSRTVTLTQCTQHRRRGSALDYSAIEEEDDDEEEEEEEEEEEIIL